MRNIDEKYNTVSYKSKRHGELFISGMNGGLEPVDNNELIWEDD